MDLCKNRPNGFEAFTIFKNTAITFPTACTIDTYLVPLPTLALVGILLFASRQLRLFHRVRSPLPPPAYQEWSAPPPPLPSCLPVSEIWPLDEKVMEQQAPPLPAPQSLPAPPHLPCYAAVLPPQVPRRFHHPSEGSTGTCQKMYRGFNIFLKYYYYVCLLFMFFKLTHEIALRVSSCQGVGLLPLTYCGITLVGMIYHVSSTTRAGFEGYTRARLLAACYWFTLGSFFALKAFVLWKHPILQGEGDEKPIYSSTSQIIDALVVFQVTLPMGMWDVSAFVQRPEATWYEGSDGDDV